MPLALLTLESYGIVLELLQELYSLHFCTLRQHIACCICFCVRILHPIQRVHSCVDIFIALGIVCARSQSYRHAIAVLYGNNAYRYL